MQRFGGMLLSKRPESGFWPLLACPSCEKAPGSENITFRIAVEWRQELREKLAV